MSDTTDPQEAAESGLSSRALFGVPVLQCAVKNERGRHCPEYPRHVVKIDGGEETMLCERCYENACAGAYGDVSVIPVREISSPNDPDPAAPDSGPNPNSTP